MMWNLHFMKFPPGKWKFLYHSLGWFSCINLGLQIIHMRFNRLNKKNWKSNACHIGIFSGVINGTINVFKRMCCSFDKRFPIITSASRLPIFTHLHRCYRCYMSACTCVFLLNPIRLCIARKPSAKLVLEHAILRMVPRFAFLFLSIHLIDTIRILPNTFYFLLAVE